MPAIDARERTTRVVGTSVIGCNAAGRLSAKGGLRLRQMTDSPRLPDSFLFRAAISAYQKEGGKVNTDWWWWEHLDSTPCQEPSDDACHFYPLHPDDLALPAT